jgi:cardiolipin synthase (CMP-forming)
VKRSGSYRGDRVLTVPNALTLLRILAIPVVLVLLLEGEDAVATTVFILAAVTDFLDGGLARRRGGAGTSHLGTVLDPVADKLMLSSVAVVLAVRGLLPAPSWRSSSGGTSSPFWGASCFGVR